VKLTLQEPIEIVSAKDGSVVSTITEITLRKPKLGDLVAAMDGGAAGKGTMTLILASRLSGLAPQDIEKMGMADGMKLLEAVADFIPAGLPTGKNGSASSRGNSGSPPTGGAGGQPNSPSGLRVQLSGEAAAEA
jgi:hypothetical protein